MSPDALKTSVSWAEPGRVLVRGYRLQDLIGRVEFGQVAYLLLCGELPTVQVGNIVEAILVAVCAHGPSTPGARATITVASTGSSLSGAVAAGVLAISKYHGGAIEDCMTVLDECVAMGLDPYESATEIVERYRSRGLRIAGIGSRTHADDPRVKALLDYAKSEGLDGPYVEQLSYLRRALTQTLSRELPINIDGAIAALLCEIKFPKEAANGLFLMSRVAGLVAHATEERSRNKPLHSLSTEGAVYDGPPEREL